MFYYYYFQFMNIWRLSKENSINIRDLNSIQYYSCRLIFFLSIIGYCSSVPHDQICSRSLWCSVVSISCKMNAAIAETALVAGIQWMASARFRYACSSTPPFLRPLPSHLIIILLLPFRFLSSYFRWYWSALVPIIVFLFFVLIAIHWLPVEVPLLARRSRVFGALRHFL